MRLKLMRCLAIRSLVCCPAGDLLVSDKSCGYSSSMISIRAFADRIGRLGFNRAPNSLPSLVLDFPTLPPPAPVVSAPSAPLPPCIVLGVLTIFSFGETLQQGFLALAKIQLVSIFGYYFSVVPVYLLLVLPPTVYVSSLVSSVV